jgi:hypothetical protein
VNITNQKGGGRHGVLKWVDGHIDLGVEISLHFAIARPLEFKKKNCFFSEQITIAVGYELANDLSLLGTLYIQYPEGTCRTQTARGSYDINLGYYVTSL